MNIFVMECLKMCVVVSLALTAAPAGHSAAAAPSPYGAYVYHQHKRSPVEANLDLTSALTTGFAGFGPSAPLPNFGYGSGFPAGAPGFGFDAAAEGFGESAALLHLSQPYTATAFGSGFDSIGYPFSESTLNQLQFKSALASDSSPSLPVSTSYSPAATNNGVHHSQITGIPATTPLKPTAQSAVPLQQNRPNEQRIPVESINAAPVAAPAPLQQSYSAAPSPPQQQTYAIYAPLQQSSYAASASVPQRPPYYPTKSVPQQQSYPATASAPLQQSYPAQTFVPQQQSNPALLSVPLQQSYPATASAPLQQSYPATASAPLQQSYPATASAPLQQSYPAPTYVPQQQSYPAVVSVPVQQSYPATATLQQPFSAAESAPQRQSYSSPGSVPQQQSYSPSGSVPQQQSYSPSGSVPQQQSYSPSGSVPQQQSYSPSASVPQQQSYPATAAKDFQISSFQPPTASSSAGQIIASEAARSVSDLILELRPPPYSPPASSVDYRQNVNFPSPQASFYAIADNNNKVKNYPGNDFGSSSAPVAGTSSPNQVSIASNGGVLPGNTNNFLATGTNAKLEQTPVNTYYTVPIPVSGGPSSASNGVLNYYSVPSISYSLTNTVNSEYAGSTSAPPVAPVTSIGTNRGVPAANPTGGQSLSYQDANSVQRGLPYTSSNSVSANSYSDSNSIQSSSYNTISGSPIASNPYTDYKLSADNFYGDSNSISPNSKRESSTDKPRSG